ncbi:hypothetical protein DFJ58DRAFT_838194 [Suillus subalutaceus]|uniref:uncharacterized protein n=1 Tax=Suillus subalutaceus TaxID=48586 RepID=UPI001B863D7C|nr:uncharacterized protein DFJ58DRAFT_838194 [Suillus subalutaceus]KAG1867184.1 hypothetical protein DFJ58DRAFT_838194 [Suillus subalutaceus]
MAAAQLPALRPCQGMGKLQSRYGRDYWSLSHILVILTQLLALLSMSVFLLMNYRDSFLDGALNHVHGYMTSATMIDVANDFSQHVKAAMIFDDEKDNKGGPTKGYVKNDIMMLQELVTKLMELAQEAGGETDKDEHEGKRNTDYLRAVKGVEETKDLSLLQYIYVAC